MDLEAFKKSAGRILDDNNGYKVFLPYKLPPAIKYDDSLVALISEASLQLGNLSGIGKLIPNPHLLISPYIIREAVLSSKIEGTQASVMDVFNFEASDRKDDELFREKRVIEVTNYVKELKECLEAVKNGHTIDLQMLMKAHKILMKDVRGQELNPGELRKAQNWIGTPGTTIHDATYVPPTPKHVEKLLKSLEGFIHNPPGRIPVLV